MSKGEKTKARIIREAAAVFNKHGFEGASMSALQAATGLEKGGLYRHFPSKEALAAAAFDYAWNDAEQIRVHGLAGTTNHVDKLRLFIANFVHRRPSVPGGCPMVNTAVDSDDGNEMLRARAQAALRQWLRLLTRIVVQGIKAGEIREDVDARAAAEILISSLEGALILSRLERRIQPLLAVEAHLYDYLDSTLRAPRSKRQR